MREVRAAYIRPGRAGGCSLKDVAKVVADRSYRKSRKDSIDRAASRVSRIHNNSSDIPPRQLIHAHLSERRASRVGVARDEDPSVVGACINHSGIIGRNADGGEIVAGPGGKSAGNSGEGVAVVGALINVIGSKVDAAGRGRVGGDGRNEIDGISIIGIDPETNADVRGGVGTACR